MAISDEDHKRPEAQWEYQSPPGPFDDDEARLARLEAFARDIATNWDHEHHSKGSVREGECDGAPQCRACSARDALAGSEGGSGG